MKCNCGGLLFVVKVHEESDPRLCDVQCGDCGKTLYYQPYDFGKNINIVRGNKEKE